MKKADLINLKNNIYEKLKEISSFRNFCNLKRTKSKLFNNIDNIKDRISNDDDINDNRDRIINNLLNNYGLSYRFDKGIIMFNRNGKMVEDVFDNDDKHYSEEIVKIANKVFDVDIPFLGKRKDIDEANLLKSKGIGTILLDGNIAQIYLPEDITTELLDNLIKEIIPRKDFIFYIVKDNKSSEELLQSETIDYINSLYINFDEETIDNEDDYIEENDNNIEQEYKEEKKDKKKKEDKKVDKKKEDVSVKEVKKEMVEDNSFDQTSKYMADLLLYTLKNKISIYEYYLSLFDLYRNGNSIDIEDFEKYNPFITADDIYNLLYSDDDLVDKFSIYMNDVIYKSLLGEEIEDNISDAKDDEETKEEDIIEKVEEKVKEYTSEDINISCLNVDLLTEMDGFVVIHEKNDKKLHVYGYNTDNPDVATGRTTFDNIDKDFESGYYINFMEFEKRLKNNFQDKDIVFVTDEMEELDYETVMNTALELSREKGAIRFGREYKNEVINNHDDLKGLYTEEQGEYKGNNLEKGLYVNKDILKEFFSKLKVKVLENDLDLKDELTLDNNTQYAK